MDGRLDDDAVRWKVVFFVCYRPGYILDDSPLVAAEFNSG